jgi:hypothetical protein
LELQYRGGTEIRPCRTRAISYVIRYDTGTDTVELRVDLLARHWLGFHGLLDQLSAGRLAHRHARLPRGKARILHDGNFLHQLAHGRIVQEALGRE